MKKVSKYLIFVMIVGIIFAFLLLLDRHIPNRDTKEFVEFESFKILFQFTLVTLLGGALFLLFNIAKEDEISNRQALELKHKSIEILADSRIQLALEIDKLYRSSKHIKRILRSRSTKNYSTFFIEKEFFERNLDDLDKIQISLEQVRENIKAKKNLFDDNTRERIISALRYAMRYLHDVFEDFEQKKAVLNDGIYEINEDCKNLQDFIESNVSDNMLTTNINAMESDDLTIDDRWQAFLEIRKLRHKSSDGRRFGSVAHECIKLAKITIVQN